MIQIVFNTILVMSIVGSIVYGVSCLLRSLTLKAFNSTWHLYTACITLLVFLVPISLIFGMLEIDLLNFFTYPRKMPSLIFKLGEGNYLESGMATVDAMLNSNGNATKFMFSRVLIEKIASILRYVWIGGVSLCIGVNLKHYLAFKKIVKRSTPISNDSVNEVLDTCRYDLGIQREIIILENSTLGTPILTGLFKPMIILPEVELHSNALKLIVSHECIHLKRQHLWIKMLLICAGIMHWFNPLFSLLRRDINKLCELSCDEELVEKMNSKDRKKYAETIISVIDKRVGIAGIAYSALNENSKNLKVRLSKIFEYNKPKIGIRILSIGVALGIVFVSVSVSSAMAMSPIEVFRDSDLPEKTDIISENLVTTSAEPIELEESNLDFKWPVPDSNCVTSIFGNRTFIGSKETYFHSGIDIAAPTGSEIYAAEAGEIIFSDWDDDYGYKVKIKHNDSYTTVYAHCSKVIVKSGDIVKSGQIIAEVGSTGKSTGPHLHFEVVKEGEAQDPLAYVKLDN